MEADRYYAPDEQSLGLPLNENTALSEVRGRILLGNYLEKGRLLRASISLAFK